VGLSAFSSQIFEHVFQISTKREHFDPIKRFALKNETNRWLMIAIQSPTIALPLTLFSFTISDCVATAKEIEVCEIAHSMGGF
jgi:hypothetical protein